MHEPEAVPPLQRHRGFGLHQLVYLSAASKPTHSGFAESNFRFRCYRNPCFEDEQTEAVMALLDRVVETGAVVPQLWPLEALNGLLAAERRGRIDGPRRRVLAGHLQALPIRVDDETAGRVWAVTAQLAERHGLTAYDAAYLELAQRLGLPLASGDKALVAAARQAGVAVLLTA